MGHAEPVPACDLEMSKESYYMLMHVVFDTSAKSTMGTPLNDHLLVGPTVHLSLVDVLLRFWRYRIKLTLDVSHMYHAELLPTDQ